MTTPVKSAIREVHDQLFLDRAVGKYLSNLSANLNFERPLLGFSNDSVWRALVRRGALDYRQVAGLFRDYLTILYGPQKTVYTCLASPAASTDMEVSVLDWDRLPQVGTLLIDEGLSTQEERAYEFRDPRNGLITMSSQITKTHGGFTANVAGELWADVAIGGTSLQLLDSGEFPHTGFPYTLIVAPGTLSEEVTTLTAHDWANNRLTISPMLTHAQKGPQPTPVVSSLLNVAAGKTVIRLTDSSQFPESGTIQLLKNDGTATKELAIYTSNDVVTGTLFLKQGLTNNYPTTTPGTTVTLMSKGITVALAQVQVKGVGWDIYTTRRDEAVIYIPRQFTRNRMQDATWLHYNGAVSASSTVGVAASIGDQFLKLAVGGATNFPRSGLVTVGSETVGYSRHDAASFTRMTRVALGTPAIPIGTTVLHVEHAAALLEFDWYNKLKKLYLARNDPANAEVVTYTSIDASRNMVTLAAGTTVAHAESDTVHPFDYPDKLYLSRPLSSAHTVGQVVSYTRPVWPATTLHDGSFGTNKFQGQFVVDFGASIPRRISTTLAEALAGPTQLAVTQPAGYATLEVKDASLFESTGQFYVRARGGGYQQDLDTNAVVLKSAVSGITIPGGAAVSDMTLVVSDASVFPRPTLDPYGYRVLIDKGLASAEVVIVASINVGTNTITVESALTQDHAAGATIELLADVIVLADPTQYEFPGQVPRAQRLRPYPGPMTPDAQISKISELRTYLKVAGITNFTVGRDRVIINFGYENAEVLEYSSAESVGGGVYHLNFADGIKIKKNHSIAEVVSLSGITSKTVGNGMDRVPYLPASMEDRLRYLFDRGRAAGVKITVIDNK